MIRSALIKLGPNFVAEIENDEDRPADGPRVTLYQLLLTEDVTAAKAEALAAVLAPAKP